VPVGDAEGTAVTTDISSSCQLVPDCFIHPGYKKIGVQNIFDIKKACALKVKPLSSLESKYVRACLCRLVDKCVRP